MPTLTRLEHRLSRRRRAHKSVSPCRTAPTRDNPDGTPVRVSLGYRVKGTHWARGYHTGEDYAAPVGSLAVAVTWGEVIESGAVSWGPAYGTAVVVRTASGKYDYLFAHLSEVHVKPGDLVRPGMVIGKTGATGNVTGPHLHFEARPAGGHYGSDIKPIRVRRMA